MGRGKCDYKSAESKAMLALVVQLVTDSNGMTAQQLAACINRTLDRTGDYLRQAGLQNLLYRAGRIKEEGKVGPKPVLWRAGPAPTFPPGMEDSERDDFPRTAIILQNYAPMRARDPYALPLGFFGRGSDRMMME